MGGVSALFLAAGSPEPTGVYGGEDIVVAPPQWRTALKPGDRFWICAEGRHFFHYEHPVAQQLAAFWHAQDGAIARPVPMATG